MTDEIKKLLKEIQDDIDQVNTLQSGILKKRAKLREICPHNDIVENLDYVPGSYYDRCQYIKRKRCNFCGFQFEDEVTYGGYC